MFEQQLSNEPHFCPQCDQKLIQRETDLVCPEHGVFFMYGQHLLVRSPRKDDDKGQLPLPWEKPASTSA